MAERYRYKLACLANQDKKKFMEAHEMCKIIKDWPQEDIDDYFEYCKTFNPDLILKPNEWRELMDRLPPVRRETVSPKENGR